MVRPIFFFTSKIMVFFLFPYNGPSSEICVRALFSVIADPFTANNPYLNIETP